MFPLARGWSPPPSGHRPQGRFLCGLISCRNHQKTRHILHRHTVAHTPIHADRPNAAVGPSGTRPRFGHHQQHNITIIIKKSTRSCPFCSILPSAKVTAKTGAALSSCMVTRHESPRDHCRPLTLELTLALLRASSHRCFVPQIAPWRAQTPPSSSAPP